MSLHISSTEGLRRLLQEALRTSSSSSTGHIEAWEGYLGSSDGDPIPYLAVRAAILAVSEHAKNSTAIEDTAESSKRNSSEASRVMSSGGSAAVMDWLAGCEVILPVPPPRVKVSVYKEVNVSHLNFKRNRLRLSLSFHFVEIDAKLQLQRISGR